MKYSTETCDTIQQALDLTSNNPTRIKLHFVVPRKFSKRGTKNPNWSIIPFTEEQFKPKLPNLDPLQVKKGLQWGSKSTIRARANPIHNDLCMCMYLYMENIVE